MTTRRVLLAGAGALALAAGVRSLDFRGDRPTYEGPAEAALRGDTVAQSAPKGSAIGTFSAKRAVGLVVYSGNTNRKFDLSPTGQLLRSARGRLVAGTPETGSVTATDAKGYASKIQYRVTVCADIGSRLTAFTVANFSGSQSKGFYRRCVHFRKGDVPAGAVPMVGSSDGRPIDHQWDERVAWSDGSLKLAVLHMRDRPFAGSERRVYNIDTAVGGFLNEGRRALSDIVLQHDLSLAFTAVNQFDGTSTANRGSGAFTASFARHAGVPSRVTKYHSGPVCESWEVWGMATDDSHGAADPDLKTIWYVSIWKTPDGTIDDVEYGAVVAQDWWGTASKHQLSYTATLQNHGTPVSTYASVEHPYHSQWMTVHIGDDDNHGRRFWANAMPTLSHTFDKTYAVQSGVYPPFDVNFTPRDNAVLGYTANYQPCSAQNHRAAIDGTGAYMGRGALPNSDAVAFMLQTPGDYRSARTNAFAGLHVPYHYRSNAMRRRPGDRAADVANTVIPLILRPQTASQDFTRQGMPTSQDAYTQGAGSERGTQPPITQGGWVAARGGTGVWKTSINASHAVSYCYAMYLLEGERHFMQATLDLALNTCHQSFGNRYGACPTAVNYDRAPMQALLNIPGTQYSAVGCIPPGNNPREAGWAMLLAGHADVVCPDADVQKGFVRAWRQHQGAYSVFNMAYMPAQQLAQGVYQSIGDGSPFYSVSPWMTNFQVIGFAMTARACEDHQALEVLNRVLQYNAIAPWETGRQMYRSADYRSLTTLKPSTSFDPVANPLLPRAAMPTLATINVVDSVIRHSVHVAPRDGDAVYFVGVNESGVSPALPAGIAEGRAYYCLDSGRGQFQVSETRAGQAVTIPNGSYGAAWQSSDWQEVEARDPPYLPNADSYTTISSCALQIARWAGATAPSQAMVEHATKFLSRVDQTGWPAWKMAA